MKSLETKSKKDDVTRNAFKKLEGLHLPSLLQNICVQMNMKELNYAPPRTLLTR